MRCEWLARYAIITGGGLGDGKDKRARKAKSN